MYSKEEDQDRARRIARNALLQRRHRAGAWLLGLLLVGANARGATFNVDNTGNAVDATPGDGFCLTAGAVCTLRAAIMEANALAGADSIHFNIVPGGLQTISPTSAYPAIVETVTIDGSTQPLFAGTPIIEVNGALAGGANPFTLSGAASSNSTVRGLIIDQFGAGIGIRILGSSNNVIAGNYIGTDPTGTVARGNAAGVFIQTGTGNRIGGSAVADRNVISGNTSDGIQLSGAGTTGSVIEGNYIGVDAGGATGLGNVAQGIAIYGGASSNLVGGPAAGSGNVISGNGNLGIGIAQAGTTLNLVQGNFIGTDAAGTGSIPNLHGVALQATASGNTIGGAIAGAGNVISGNTSNGILIDNANANTVQRNRIGTDVSGTADLGNTQHGIQILLGASSNVIGGAPSDGNVISGNGLNGVDIIGATTSGNVITGNIIGLDAAGDADLGNTDFGVAMAQGANGNIIGDVGGGNIISGNDKSGVRIVDPGTNDNLVQLNYIGLDISGTLARPNTADGVILDAGGAATGNVIGGSGLGNVISGNGGRGVHVRNAITSTTIAGNRIGTDAAGTAGIGNGSHGVYFAAGASNNIVGGTSVGERNVISANVGQAIRIDGATTDNNVIAGNFIGTDAAGTSGLPGSSGGIAITNSAANNTIGGTAAGAGNLIAFNASYGINLASGAGDGNAILGNDIHSNVELAIDLEHDGVTTNDPGGADADLGPNGLQNYPELSGAVTTGVGNVHIAGSLDSAPGTTFRVEFFASSVADPTGFGEAERYLGFTNVLTDASGNAVFGVALGATVLVSEVITATATDAGNNTSELSATVTVSGDLVVTTTADTVDGTTTSVAALIIDPGTDDRISLREAIQATNASPGPDTIVFGIPLADAGHVYYQDDTTPSSLSSVATTTLADANIMDFDPDYPPGFTRSWYRIQPNPVLTTIMESTVIDAETQPGAIVGAPVIELDGSAGGGTTGLSLMSGPGAVKGFVIHGFTDQGLALRGAVSGYVVTGNYLGTDVSGTVGIGNGQQGIFIGEIGGAASTIGGSTLAARNLISANGTQGIYLWAFGAPGISSQIRIQGNYIGTDVTGTVGLGGQGNGVTAEFTGGHLIGGSGAGEGNLISGNTGRAIELNGNLSGSGTGADNNVIEGNSIGTDATGTAALGNGERGIIMFATTAGSSTSNNIIRGNVIAASGGGFDGIWMAGNADGNLLENNFIGTDAGGTIDLGNTGSGIHVEGAGAFLPTGNTIRSNAIRYNDLDGVQIVGTGSSATLTQNAIWSNDGLAIDLGDDGVTVNDAGDVDPGPNAFLNFPGIYLVSESGGTLTVDFSLDLQVAGSYRVEFFKNPSGADPSGYGEGQVFASTTTITHAGAGFENFSHNFAGVLGETVTATATFCIDGAPCAVLGDTSELSNVFIEGVTAVELSSFTATARDGAVELRWQTASELDNLGFHVRRASSSAGRYERVSAVLIPGLGSSPSGATYRYRDEGLTNGLTYYYELEDIDTRGRSELHGPVWAMPDAEATDSDDEDVDGSRITVGDPSRTSLEVTSRSRNEVVLELETGGFYAELQDDGSVRLSIPGFEAIAEPDGPALPVKRTWLEAIAGRGVKLLSVRAHDVEVLDGGLFPSGVDVPEIIVGDNGTVRAAPRGAKRRARAIFMREGLDPAEPAHLSSVGYQGDVKKALVELAPLRWDAAQGRLVLAHRLVVRLAFRGREPDESTTESRLGGRRRALRGRGDTVVARLATRSRGLYAVSFEDIFGGQKRPVRTSSLRLGRHGETTRYHIEPNSDRFGPGTTLYFMSEGATLNPYGSEAVYELELGADFGATTMDRADASPAGELTAFYWQTVRMEHDRYYQAALVEAPDPWFWELILSPETKSFPFRIDALASAADPARLSLWLQGASDSPGSPDHHVRVYLNHTLVGELFWDGKQPRSVDLEIPMGALVEGENELELENVGDSAADYSMVMLDRFEVVYPRQTIASDAELEGSWSESGVAEISGLGAGSVLLDTTETNPSWLEGAQLGPDELVRARVEVGRRYLAVSPSASLRPELRSVRRKPPKRRLVSEHHRADYIIIAPREFLPAASPLLKLRRRQGLRTKAIAVEDIYSEFGFGEASPEAIKEFLSYAYHVWRKPAPRYVVLLGDATFDFKDDLGTGVTNQVPPLMIETTYLWTASDPSYAAVNGDDILPDFAIGRLPAATIAQARLMVAKIVAYERGAVDREPAPVVLIADDADEAGDFTADAEALASTTLSGRDIKKIYLSDVGVATARESIVRAFDDGASVVSFMGHGAIHLWADENLFNISAVSSLSPQAQQPLVLTMNCLNGYFHFPYFDSLAEALLKAEGKGAVAAFSPSGLSLNAPAHGFHEALLEQLIHGNHARLGDAVMAAQEDYARSGAFPELLSIYHLFGDPALRLRK